MVKLWSSFVGSLSCLLGCHRGSCRNVYIHYGFIFHLSCSDLSEQNRKLETKVSHGEQGSRRVPLWTLQQYIHLTTNVLFIVFVTHNQDSLGRDMIRTQTCRKPPGHFCDITRVLQILEHRVTRLRFVNTIVCLL